VVIFDECHRSQFGDMHTDHQGPSSATTCSASPARRSSPKTAGTGGNPQLRTTEQAFGDKLHTYTIVDAINDKNVLPFRIDYINTIKMPERRSRQAGVGHRHRAGAARARAHRADRRLHPRALRPEDQTQRSYMRHGGKRLKRLQFAVCHRVDRRGQTLLQRVRRPAEGRPDQRLKVGLIYSFAANEEVGGRLLDEEEFETDGAGSGLARFPRGAIQDYNALFGTSFDTSPTSSRTTTRTCRSG
jgi:type I restriction enzyme R subunit